MQHVLKKHLHMLGHHPPKPCCHFKGCDYDVVQERPSVNAACAQLLCCKQLLVKVGHFDLNRSLAGMSWPAQSCSGMLGACPGTCDFQPAGMSPCHLIVCASILHFQPCTAPSVSDLHP